MLHVCCVCLFQGDLRFHDACASRLLVSDGRTLDFMYAAPSHTLYERLWSCVRLCSSSSTSSSQMSRSDAWQFMEQWSMSAAGELSCCTCSHPTAELPQLDEQQSQVETALVIFCCRRHPRASLIRNLLLLRGLHATCVCPTMHAAAVRGAAWASLCAVLHVSAKVSYCFQITVMWCTS